MTEITADGERRVDETQSLVSLYRQFSPMAEGYLRHLASDKFNAMSAGIEPKGLNPLAEKDAIFD